MNTKFFVSLVITALVATVLIERAAYLRETHQDSFRWWYIGALLWSLAGFIVTVIIVLKDLMREGRDGRESI